MSKNKQDNSCCLICMNSTLIELTNDAICKDKGVVSGDFICKRFKLDPFKINTKKLRAIDTSNYSHIDFSIE